MMITTTVVIVVITSGLDKRENLTEILNNDNVEYKKRLVYR